MDDKTRIAALTAAAQNMQAGNLDEMERVLAPVFEALPEDADANIFMAIARQKQGRIDEAVPYARVAAANAPNEENILGTLGTILMAGGKQEEAVEVFQKITQLNPKSAQGLFTLGSVLQHLMRFDEAAEAFKALVRVAPERPQAKRNLAIALYEAERYEEALEPARIAADSLPNDMSAQFAYGKISLAAGQPEMALAVFDRLKGDGLFVSKAHAYREVALRELGLDAEADAISRFDDYVRPMHLKPPPGFATIKDFNDAVCAEMLSHPNLEDAPPQRATRNGQKVTRLLENPSPLMATFGEMIKGAVAEMQVHLKRDASDGPFSPSPPPGPCAIDLWVNIMHRQGHQRPHFHPQGWLSGCYYARVPERIETSGDAHEGWIEFGQPAYHLPHTKPPKLHLVKPEEGLIVLFPSYLFHRTIPFDSDEPRISFAFDLVPRAWVNPGERQGEEV